MTIKLFFSFFFMVLSFVGQHEYYLSTTTVKWVPKQQQIQFTSRFFLEDIEALMQAETGTNIVFSPDSSPAEIDAFVKAFYLESVSVELDGNKQHIQYLGREYKDDLLMIYAEITPVNLPFKAIDIRADFLVNFLSNQQNIIHIKTPKQKKSFLLTQTKTALNFTL